MTKSMLIISGFLMLPAHLDTPNIKKLLEYPKKVAVPDNLPSIHVCETKSGAKITVIPVARYLEGHFFGWQEVLRRPDDVLAAPEKNPDTPLAISHYEPFTPRGVVAGREAARECIRGLIKLGLRKETIIRGCRESILPGIKERYRIESKSPGEYLKEKGRTPVQ